MHGLHFNLFVEPDYRVKTQAAFDRAVAEIAHATGHLLEDLVTTAPPKNREVEAEKARARARVRYGT